MRLKVFIVAALCAGALVPGFAAIIGTNTPAMPLTAERVASSPVWKAYLASSVRQRQADQNSLEAELKAHGLTQATLPQETHNVRGLVLDNPLAWYASNEARHIADTVVSFQTPAGGWSKNTDFTGQVRAPGEMYGVENGSLHLTAGDFDLPKNPHWSYVGTFDNDSTTTELRFLAKVISANPSRNEAWRRSFLRGLDYIFLSQFPNGGWPQVWPLQGGYHDAITFNDDAMLHILELLHDIAVGRDEFLFVPSTAQTRAIGAFHLGMNCLMATQVTVQGKRTAWCQQYDSITLAPASARNYEMPALASSESATIAQFLMSLPHPDANEIKAVHAVCHWFEKTKITGYQFKNTGVRGRELVSAPGDRPLWARYYQIGTDKPIFGDRDKTIHDEVDDLSKERRNGYGWYGDAPEKALKQYHQWAISHPEANQ